MIKTILLAGTMMIAAPAVAQTAPMPGRTAPGTAQTAPSTGQAAPTTGQNVPAPDRATPTPAPSGSTATPSANPADRMTPDAATPDGTTPTTPTDPQQPDTAAAVAPSHQQVAQVVDQQFATYDKDGNGALSKAEFASWMTSLKSQAPTAAAETPAQQTAWNDAAFKQADGDKSATVTKTELTSFLVKGAAQAG